MIIKIRNTISITGINSSVVMHITFTYRPVSTITMINRCTLMVILINNNSDTHNHGVGWCEGCSKRQILF